MANAELNYLEPTIAPTTAQDPSAPIIGHTDAETTGRLDADGSAIVRQRVATPTIPVEAGVWGYLAGTNGTVNVPANGKVLGIAAYGGGTFTINGGNSVPVPSGGGCEVAPRGNLVAPTIVFTATTSYFVEYVV